MRSLIFLTVFWLAAAGNAFAYEYNDVLLVVGENAKARLDNGAERDIPRMSHVYFRKDAEDGLHVTGSPFDQKTFDGKMDGDDLRRITECLELISGELEKSPTAELHIARAVAHRERLEFAKALDDLDSALFLEPANDVASAHRGFVCEQMRDLAGAIEDYDKAVRIDPDNAQWRIHRGRALGKNGKLKLAFRDFDKAIELAPDDASAYVLRALAHEANGKKARAFKDFDKAIELNPNSPEAWFERAMRRNKPDEMDKAIADFDKALEAAPTYSRALSYRGMSSGMSGNLDGARKDFQTLIQLQSDNPATLSYQSLAYQMMKNFDKAIECLSRQIELEPWNATAYSNRAIVRRLNGQSAEALADDEQALKLDGSDWVMMGELARTLATDPKAEIRDGKRAVELATKACKLSKWKHAYLIDILAMACAETGDFANAVKWGEKAVSLEADKDKTYLEDHLKLYREGKPVRDEEVKAEGKRQKAE